MNSLSNQWYAGWKIEHTIYGIPCIRKISETESEIHLKLPEIQKIPAVPQQLPEVTLHAPKQSQLVFEF
jgi:hypothetical protein